MSETRFERTLTVAAPTETVAAFFADCEVWFRLNPEWEVLALDAGNLKVRYERSEAEADYRVEFRRVSGNDFVGDVVLVGASPRTLHLEWRMLAADCTRLSITEVFAVPLETQRLAELNLWADAAAGYLAVAARRDRRGRLMHWLLDRVWLKLSPTARRVGLLIVVMETLALLLFIAVLLIYRFIG